MKRTIASILAVVPMLLSGCGGAVEEAPEPVEATIEVGGIEQKIVLNGSGTLYDNGTDRITYQVTWTGDTSKAQFELRTPTAITWWKSLDIFSYVNGQYVHAKRIETKDSRHYASVDYFAGEMTSPYKVEFWKAGVFGAGAYVTAIQMDNAGSVGKRFTFTWERD